MAREVDWANIIDIETVGNETEAPIIQMVSVYDIQPHEENEYPMTDIEELAGIIEMQGGVHTPLQLIKLPDGKYKAVKGHRRRLAVIMQVERGSEVITPFVPAIIKQYKDKDDEIIDLFFDNIASRERSPEIIAMEIIRLEPIARRKYKKAKDEKKYKGSFRKFYAEGFFHISESKLQRYLSLIKLDTAIKEKIANGQISPTAAALITSFKVEEQVELVEKISSVNGKVTVKAIEEQIERKKQPKATPIKAPEVVKLEATPVKASEVVKPEAIPGKEKEIEGYTKIPIDGKISGIGVAESKPTLTIAGKNYIFSLLNRKIEVFEQNSSSDSEALAKLNALKIVKQHLKVLFEQK